MSDLFNNVKPGDVVHYKTPQGQHGKGKVVLRYDTHVVVNRGKGQPQVVNDNNYVKHERGGKVIGALLSRLKEDKALVAKNKKFVDDKMNKAYMARSGEAWERVHAKYPGIVTRLAARLKGTKLNKQGKVDEASWQGAGDPYNWDPVMRQQVFAAAAKENRAKQIKKGQPVPHELDKGRTLKSKPAPFRRGSTNEALIATIKSKLGIKPGTSTGMPATGRPGTAAKRTPMGGYHAKNKKGEDRKFPDKASAEKWLQSEDNKDVGGEAERVAKTKKHKKKLVAELDNSTLASYVTKALKDRKTSQSGFEMAGRIHTGERKKHFQDKAFARISKRTKGIQTAVGKIANNLPAEPLKAHADSEGAKHGGWQPHVREARESEYTANIHMAQGAAKTAKGHYLMRDGRKLSGPHSPEEAVKAYKGLASQGTDTKGVKIVHVKEGVEVDVTAILMEGAGAMAVASLMNQKKPGGGKDKVKKAAEKAISLAKKAKGNKHVDTEPKLDIQDKGGGPMGGSHEDPEGSVDAKI